MGFQGFVSGIAGGKSVVETGFDGYDGDDVVGMNAYDEFMKY